MTSDTPSAGRFEGRTHILPVRIYYEDTDFSGIVYHANYLRYFERGRSDFLRLAGVHHNALLDAADPIAFAVNRITLEFLKPARIDDALVVKSHFDAMKGPRILITQQIEKGADVLVKAALEVCCISLTGRPRKPPPILREQLAAYLAPE
ncbi:MAG: tol-pal system-associated acyl-CoA thioesterase [Terricaulis sp.]